MWEGFFCERRTAPEVMNGDLRKIMDKTNGDLRKISVYTSGDSGYNSNKEVIFIWKDMYLNVKFIMKYLNGKSTEATNMPFL